MVEPTARLQQALLLGQASCGGRMPPASLPRSNSAAAASVPAGGSGYAKRSMRTDTTRPPMVVLFIVLTASSAASLVGKRTMPKPLHRKQRAGQGRAGQG